jgi:Zn finger protein HypA/HybF involved in hydrogenase expression
MSINFKIKEKKLDKNKKISETLDSKHMDVLKEIHNIHKKLPELEKNLNELKHKLNEINTFIANAEQTDLLTNTIDILEDKNYILKYELEDKIKSLEDEINNIRNNKYIDDYFNKTGHLLYYYYDGNKVLDKEYNETNDNNSFNNSDSETDSDKMNNDDEQDDLERDFELEKEFQEKVSKKRKITDFIEKEDGLEKAELYDKYIKLIKDQTFVQKDIFIKKGKSEIGAICSKCNISLSLITTEGLQVCPKCGRQEYILIDSEKPSFREPPPEVSYFAYKRINHFNEWLSQFQAKESTEIHPDIYKLIFLEMKKERITDLNKVTPKKIREYLKKLKLNKYYEHVPHILNKLNNKKVPAISKETEEKLRNMFKEIQAPFMKVCPPNRKNFLSYSYVLHKFVELLGLDHLKECFPLLKSREKLHQQDQIWKEICKELNWMYIKSI